jgi:hypothetical protein
MNMKWITKLYTLFFFQLFCLSKALERVEPLLCNDRETG